MAAYTQSIREILQQNKQPSQSLLEVQDIHDIAAAVLFDKAPMNVIDQQYRDNLITGFTLHFFNDEIGLETLPLWKIALNEKIYNSGSYINKIYANLDKEVFAKYQVDNKSGHGTLSETVLGTGTIGVSGSKTVNNTGTESTATDITDTLNGQKVTVGTGGESHTLSGTDTRTLAGKETDTRSGNDTVKHTGKDTLEKLGSELQQHGGTDTTSEQHNDNLIESTGNANYENAIGIQSDTPMGQLSNMRTPGGAAAGNAETSVSYGTGVPGDGDTITLPEYGDPASNTRGFNYEDAQTYNYMSGATEEGKSSTGYSNHSNHAEGGMKNEYEHGEKIWTAYGVDGELQTDARKDEQTYASDNKTEYNSKIEKEYTNRTDSMQFGKIDTLARNNLTDTTNTDDERTVDQDVVKTLNTQNADTHSDTTTRNTTDTKTGSTSDTQNNNGYEMNWEMLYESMPLLNKVWEIFDDLFMQIY